MAWKSNSPEYIQNRATHKDTQEHCKTDLLLVEAIKSTKNNQEVIPEIKELPELNPDVNNTPNIFVSNKRTIQAAKGHIGEKTCILNFASSTKAGGGVTYGCGAQEETICHITTLYPCISDKKCKTEFYDPHRALKNALYNDDIIYSPSIIAFKNDNQSDPHLLPAEEWFTIDVLTCAAPNLGNKPSNRYNPDGGDKVHIASSDLLVLLKKRTERILQVAASKGVEVLILGAFGCGAFHNPPELVAEAFDTAIAKYGKYFKTIEFAIPGVNQNSVVFKRWFSDNIAGEKPIHSGPTTAVHINIGEKAVELPDIPNIVGKKISHNTYGPGTVTEQKNGFLTVKFESFDKIMKFEFVFTGPAHLEDAELDKSVCEIAQIYKNNR